MKVSILYILSFCILLAYSTYSFFQLQNYHDEVNNLYEENDYMSFQNKLLIDGVFYAIELNNIDENCENYALEDIVPQNYEGMIIDDNLLVLALNLSGCSDCMLEEIERIKELGKSQNIGFLIGIVGLSDKEYRAYVSNYDILEHSFPLKVNLPLFPHGSILYFVLTPNHKLKYFFAPSENLPYLTDQYLQKLISESYI